ncbi:MAG: hypothetical protein ACLVJO_02215 [[Clostridium] scindens]
MIVEGSPYKADSEYKLVRSHIGVVDGNKYQSLIFPDLTVRENMEMAVYKKTTVCGCFINGRVKRYLDRIGMRSARIAGSTRDGQCQQKGCHADHLPQMAATKPKILFCFQPFLRLDAVSRQQWRLCCWNLKARERGSY